MTVEVTGAKENGEGYFINEGEEFEILCKANGNPSPGIEILVS